LGVINFMCPQNLATCIKGRKAMVFSHHLGLSLDGSSRTTLFRQVAGSPGQILDYWYWGHAHNAAVYKPQGKFHGRVCGHGAIPYGNATILENSMVEWYENSQPYPPASNLRIKNGFVVVELNGPNITEHLMDEDGCVSWSSSHC